MVRARAALVCAFLVLAGASLGACSSSGGKSVDVVLNDFTLKPAVSSVVAGDVKFKVKNIGGFIHEMRVVKAADASDLPVEKSGRVNVDAIPKAQVIGKAAKVKPGKTATLKLTLAAGKYVLFCNLVDGASVHFKKGMHADFTVTG